MITYFHHYLWPTQKPLEILQRSGVFFIVLVQYVSSLVAVNHRTPHTNDRSQLWHHLLCAYCWRQLQCPPNLTITFKHVFYFLIFCIFPCEIVRDHALQPVIRDAALILFPIIWFLLWHDRCKWPKSRTLCRNVQKSIFVGHVCCLWTLQVVYCIQSILKISGAKSSSKLLTLQLFGGFTRLNRWINHICCT